MNPIRAFEAVNKARELRNEILTTNISNAHVKGAKAQDLKIDFSGLIEGKKIGVSTTNASHIGGSSNNVEVKKFNVKAPKNLSGNNITISDEMVKLTENAEGFKINSSLLKEFWALIKTSIGN